jgi:hypothetical protein
LKEIVNREFPPLRVHDCPRSPRHDRPGISPSCRLTELLGVRAQTRGRDRQARVMA